MSSKALFLDRDGTLIVHRPYLCDPSGVELLSGVREALQAFVDHDYILFLFTNQSGIGRGLFDLSAVQACNQRLIELLDLSLGGFTEICIAPETPEMPQIYRKPSPRFILEMIVKYGLNPDQTWMVGDSISDIQAGLNAGVSSVLIGMETGLTLPIGVLRADSLLTFHDILLGRSAGYRKVV
jgi:D-glycero-D-manno-heptose 1,7-bisphosphate phosphatase